MLLADVLFLAIVVYLAYRFIFNFLLPIVRATHQVRQQFRDNFGGAAPGNGSRGAGQPGQTTAGANNTGARSNGSTARKRTYKPPAEDYIDFEEIKK